MRFCPLFINFALFHWARWAFYFPFFQGSMRGLSMLPTLKSRLHGFPPSLQRKFMNLFAHAVPYPALCYVSFLRGAGGSPHASFPRQDSDQPSLTRF